MNVHGHFMKQRMMRKVLLSLLPIIVWSAYSFGLRVLVLLAVVTIAGVLTEYWILRFINPKNVKVSEAVLVTCCLFVLTLPPFVPFWVAVVGIVFGVLFGKGVFGGFGKNVFNPALVGRCFIYISFPNHMTATWVEPFRGFPGGLIQYSGGIDALATATPLAALGQYGELTSAWHLFTGTIQGSLGETSALLIVLAALYLVFTKTASWKIMVSTLGSAFLFTSVLRIAGVAPSGPLFALLAGGFLFGSVFMATDPVSAPSSDTARVIYGVLIGFFTVLIREFAAFTGGMMFAILIANTFVPLLDMKVKEHFARKQVTA